VRAKREHKFNATATRRLMFNRQSIIRLEFLAIAALLIPVSALHLQASSSPPAQLPSCDAHCPESHGFCHWRLAVFFLRGIEAELPQCVSAQLSALKNLDSTHRILLGIRELDAAISNPAGIEQPISELQLEKGGAYIDLAHSYNAAGDMQSAQAAFRNAVGVYQSIETGKGTSSRDGIAGRIASGMIRANDPMAAISSLQNLPQSNPDRLYLTAEALFAVQNRADAAKYYELWIKNGCNSHLYMLTDDSYGEKWSLLLLKQPTKQSKCEQLPAELRSRLETLNHQFGHPNNIPAHSYPATLFRSVQDF
jgi:hypothetical protein